MKQSLTIILVFGTTITFGQFCGDFKVPKDSIFEWKVNDSQDYNGIYRFGYSEEESELRIFGNDSIRIAQLQAYVWQENKWIDTFRLFTNVEINGSDFYADQAKGRFVKFNVNSKTQKGLWIFTPWSYEFYEGGEIGSKYPAGLDGRFPEASVRVLPTEYLQQMSLDELKIMRNEIFARYCYRFREGGKMDTYFSSQEWYYSGYESVDHFLTRIEKENISRIKKIEKKKHGSE